MSTPKIPVTKENYQTLKAMLIRQVLICFANIDQVASKQDADYFRYLIKDVTPLTDIGKTMEISKEWVNPLIETMEGSIAGLTRCIRRIAGEIDENHPTLIMFAQEYREMENILNILKASVAEEGESKND